jgi:hypothetical protein
VPGKSQMTKTDSSRNKKSELTCNKERGWINNNNKKNLPIKKSPDPDGFIGEFFHKFTVKSTLILIELHKVEEEADFSLCVSAIALTSKSEKNDNKNADH